MLSNKSKGFQKLIFERICEIHDEILMSDHEYRELGKIPSKLFERLFTKLPAEDREILDQYSSESMNQLNRQDEIIYAVDYKMGSFYIAGSIELPEAKWRILCDFFELRMGLFCLNEGFIGNGNRNWKINVEF